MFATLNNEQKTSNIKKQQHVWLYHFHCFPRRAFKHWQTFQWRAMFASLLALNCENSVLVLYFWGKMQLAY